MDIQSSKWPALLMVSATSLFLVACQNDVADVTAGAPEISAEVTEAPAVDENMQDVAPVDPVETETEELAQTESAPVSAPPVAPPPSAAPAAPPPAPKPPPAPAAQYAQVVSVTPVRQSEDHPEVVCHDVEVVYQVDPKDEHKIAGTAIGAIVGGVVGNQVGGGKGRKVARVAGAVAGGAAGRKIQGNQQGKNTETRIEQQCEEINDPTFTTVGYDIVYLVGDQTYTARVADDPGDRIKLPVRNLLD